MGFGSTGSLVGRVILEGLMDLYLDSLRRRKDVIRMDVNEVEWGVGFYSLSLFLRRI